MASLNDFPIALLPIIDAYLPLGGRNEFRQATGRDRLANNQLQQMAEAEAPEVYQNRIATLQRRIQINQARAATCEQVELTERIAQCRRVLDSHPKSVESLRENLNQVFATPQESQRISELVTKDSSELHEIYRTTPYSFMVSQYLHQLHEDFEQWNVEGIIEGLRAFSNVLQVLNEQAFFNFLVPILARAFNEQNVEVIEAVLKTNRSLAHFVVSMQGQVAVQIELLMNQGHHALLRKVLDLDFAIITEPKFYQIIMTTTSLENSPMPGIFLRSKQWNLLKNQIAPDRLQSMIRNLEGLLKAIVEAEFQARITRYFEKRI